MTEHTKDSPQKPESQDATGNVDARRRRLLATGASSPLLLTIASRPAWAQDGQCTASAMASANASGTHDFAGCSISAGWWKNFKHRWPIAYTTSFHSIFDAVRYKGSILYDGFSLGNVIDLNGGSDPAPGTFGFHLIGAYLNALTFPPDRGVPGYAFTPQQVVDAYKALYGADTSSVSSSRISSEGKSGKGRHGKDGKEEYNAADSQFQALASTLEAANNQFDSTTDKPETW